MCLDNSDWLGVAKVSELERIPSYGDDIQLPTRVSSPENCPSYSRFRVIKVRVIETNLYMYYVLHELSVGLDEGEVLSCSAVGFLALFTSTL